MKKAARAAYLTLAAELRSEIEPHYATIPGLDERLGCSLCHLCRFGEWCDGIDCQHPLIDIPRVNIDPMDVWAGGDCWLFRPNYRDVDDAREEYRSHISREIASAGDDMFADAFAEKLA